MLCSLALCCLVCRNKKKHKPLGSLNAGDRGHRQKHYPPRQHHQARQRQQQEHQTLADFDKLNNNWLSTDMEDIASVPTFHWRTTITTMLFDVWSGSMIMGGLYGTAVLGSLIRSGRYGSTGTDWWRASQNAPREKECTLLSRKAKEMFLEGAKWLRSQIDVCQLFVVLYNEVAWAFPPTKQKVYRYWFVPHPRNLNIYRYILLLSRLKKVLISTHRAAEEN